jgi:hypothetical protein
MTDELTQHFKNTSSTNIIEIIKTGNWNDILHGICNIKDNLIFLNYSYFKHFGTKETYNIVLNYIIAQLDNLLTQHNQFIVYSNIKSLTVAEVDKHKKFIQHVSTIMNEKYPDKLVRCYIYNAPFIFSQIMSMVSLFIDKETQQKFILVSNKV